MNTVNEAIREQYQAPGLSDVSPSVLAYIQRLEAGIDDLNRVRANLIRSTAVSEAALDKAIERAVAETRAENERLRKALQQLNLGIEVMWDDSGETWVLRKMTDVIRQALTEDASDGR